MDVGIWGTVELNDPPVLIVGAGPTGLVLALWLAKAGVPFRLIDQKKSPGEGSRAMAVQARTLEFYHQLGIVDSVIAAGFRLDQVHLRDRSGEIASIPLGEVGKSESPYPFALSLPQDDHERLLIGQLHKLGIAVEWETELTSFVHGAEGVNATLKKTNGESIWTGQYLCGCDGASSAVRHGLGIGFPGGTYDQLFYVADAEAVGPWSTHEINAHIAVRTLCLAFPIRTLGMFRFIGLIPDRLRGRDDIAFADFQKDVEDVTATRITRVNWFSTYRVHHRVADRFQIGRVFLAGDAGHIHSPAGGQGMNTGIGDAVNLAWKLAAVLGGRAGSQILYTYDAERRPFARSLVATTDRVFDAVVGRTIFARLIRTVFAPYVLPFILGFSAVRRAQFRLVSQTRIAYRTSPLNDGTTHGADAGDRLPWVEGSDNFEPLKSLDWQIHVYGTATSQLRAWSQARKLALHEWPWTDAAGLAGLVKDAVYLVRPDGYLGFVRETQNVQELENYLNRHGIK